MLQTRDSDMTIEQAFNDHSIAMLHYAHKLLGDRQAAEDLVQDVFLKLLVSGISPGKVPLFRVVHNDCVNYLKRETLQSKYASSLPADAGIEQELFESEVFSHIAKAVHELPAQTRKVIIMKYYDGKKLREIADILNISIHTVRNLAVKGVEKLKA